MEFALARRLPSRARSELTHESWRTRCETAEGVNQADGRLNRTRATRDASAVCKHPNPDAEGSVAPSHTE